jgi:hypothetical protein
MCILLKKKEPSEMVAARWSHLPGGGCWWSTMSEQTEITAHSPIYFFGHGSPRGPCDICPGVVVVSHVGENGNPS